MADPGAASNHIRSAIEQLMNYLKVKHFDRKNGKLVELSLHRRILDYGAKKKALADKLLAIKWLGNAGATQVGLQRTIFLTHMIFLNMSYNSFLIPHIKISK
jgi:hypothetical protein